MKRKYEDRIDGSGHHTEFEQKSTFFNIDLL